MLWACIPLDIVESLLDEGEAGTYDLVYIDADKGNYDTYYELALKLVRPKGIIACDNVSQFISNKLITNDSTTI